MEIRIRLLGGPLHAQVAKTETLDKCKVFFDERQRQVLLYVRENDVTEYLFSPVLSGGLTEKYDEAYAKWGTNEPSMKFVPPEEPFSETMIREEGSPPEYRNPAQDGETFLPPALDFDPDAPSQRGDAAD